MGLLSDLVDKQDREYDKATFAQEYQSTLDIFPDIDGWYIGSSLAPWYPGIDIFKVKISPITSYDVGYGSKPGSPENPIQTSITLSDYNGVRYTVNDEDVIRCDCSKAAALLIKHATK